MPILVGDPPESSGVETLLVAGDNLQDDDSPGMLVCEFAAKKKKEEEKRKLRKSMRMLMWNIFELGGGYYMPEIRPQYAIDAYATLLQKMDLHVVVLLGLTRTVQDTPTSKTAGHNSYVVLDPEPKDTGPAEAARILAKLQELDGGSGWKMEIPKPRGGAGDRYLYNRWTTAAFLYASSKGVTFTKFDILAGPDDPAMGMTGTLVCATFDAPAYKTDPLRVIASLGLPTPERPRENLRKPAPEPELVPTASMPTSAVIFLSVPAEAKTPPSIGGFQAEVDAEFMQPGPEGTVLGDEFWKVVSENKDGLLDNFIAVNLGNVVMQDEQMHWEALEDPEHIDSARKLPGYLADGMAVIHHLATPPPLVQEIRIVDLLAAGLPGDSIEKLKAKPVGKPADKAAPPENSALLAQRKAYHDREIGGPEPKADSKNQLAECGYFSRTLSWHWPVVTQLQMGPD